MIIKKIAVFLFLILVFSGLLYGSTYQQFRYFDINNPGGAADSLNYLRMADGDYDVSPIAKYRFMVPFLAGKIKPLIKLFELDSATTDILAFYCINFAFMLLAAILSFFIFRNIGFGFYKSILGAVFFICSRTTALITGAPLVDSIYILSIAVIILLTQYKRYRVLALLNPFLALTKETIFPFMLIPLRERDMRRREIFISLAFSMISVICVRKYMDSVNLCHNGESLYYIVKGHILALGPHFKHLFSFKGFFDITNAFSTLLIFSASGFFINKLGFAKKYQISSYHDLIIAITLGFAVLSGNLERMFFAAYIPIIAYALIGLEFAIERLTNDG